MNKKIVTLVLSALVFLPLMACNTALPETPVETEDPAETPSNPISEPMDPISVPDAPVNCEDEEASNFQEKGPCQYAPVNPIPTYGYTVYETDNPDVWSEFTKTGIPTDMYDCQLTKGWSEFETKLNIDSNQSLKYIFETVNGTKIKVLAPEQDEWANSSQCSNWDKLSTTVQLKFYRAAELLVRIN